ncbi:hypothetical protein [Psychrobacter pacificensis]|uniref:hypothetical protein n=1 Tax=Psychrobacter pacificensis TaxID=112002 RepID=UPI001CC0E45F|nr:hypothetical protein [Psychrobacter pacificensis]MBZ1392296.1 hypothetical protein [Psychrobacter pacificensis]
MSVENLVDNYYQLHVSEDATAYNKIEHLTEAGFPDQEKMLDDVTPTDARITINAVVDFKESSAIEFTYVYDPDNAQHQLLQTSFDANTELNWQFVFVNAPTLSREFKGFLSNLTPSTDDPRQKTRMNGTITITSVPTAIA